MLNQHVLKKCKWSICRQYVELPVYWCIVHLKHKYSSVESYHKLFNPGGLKISINTGVLHSYMFFTFSENHKAMPDVITIESDSEDMPVMGMETYLAERDCCVDINGDISPSEEPVRSSDIDVHSIKTRETLDYLGELKKVATHLVDISSVTLKQQSQGIFSDEDIAFSNLVDDCGNELMGLGEYLLDVTNSINQNKQDSTNVSQELSILLSLSDTHNTRSSDDDDVVINTPRK